MTPSTGRQRLLLALVFLAALALRVVPGWEAAYGDGFVDLQGGDASFHLRSIEALIANFPRRPGFDPYALYPGGMNVPTGPFFDYLAATVALTLGLGNPSPELVRQVAAWIPPLFGALCVVPLFWIGRALAGPWAGLLAAAWFAVCSGHTVYYAKIGFADHHIFEALFYAVAVFGLIRAFSDDDPARRHAWTAGAALGLALLNRPAAAFLGPLFGVWAAVQTGVELGGRRVFNPRPVVTALLLGWLFLLPAGVGAWGALPHLAMAGGAACALVAWLGAAQVVRRGWPAWAWFAAMALAAVAGLAVALAVFPAAFPVLQEGFADALAGGESRLVAEVRSPIRHGGQWSVRPLFVELGAAGFLALPAFTLMGFAAVRSRDRALSLIAVTGLFVYAAALLQVRMSIYAAVNLSVAVGWCVWKLLAHRPLRSRFAWGLAVLAVFYVPSAAIGWAVSAREAGMSPEWRAVTDWLRLRTPDPLGDPAAFLRDYSRLGPGESFGYPPAAYGVLVWWDLGYWVLAEGRRPPIANGTQAGALEAAQFYISNDAGAAIAGLDALGARYVIVDNTLPVPPLQVQDFESGELRAMAGWTGEPLEDLLGVYAMPQEGGTSQPVLVFYPRYFESMAMRLYLHGGAGYEPRNATTVFALRDSGGPLKIISSQRTFETFERARSYLEARPDQDLILGTLDPYRSCVPLGAVPGLRKVFESGEDSPMRAVKVFERAPLE